jgi:hypothetical protein
MYRKRECQRFRLESPGTEASEGGEKFKQKARKLAEARATAAARPAMAAILATGQPGLSSVGATGQSAASSTGPPGTTARLTPRGSVASGTSADPPLEGNSAESRQYRKRLMRDITDKKIQELTKGARKKVASDGTPFLSHTDRWNRDSIYRAQMQNGDVPKWLVWTSIGFTVRLDGQPGDQWPVV